MDIILYLEASKFMYKYTSSQLPATFNNYFKGSDYRYAWPDTIQMKRSVCHSNGVDLVA